MENVSRETFFIVFHIGAMHFAARQPSNGHYPFY